jgi:hypothetical protein
MSLVFGEDACDRGKSPVLIRLMKFGCKDACVVQLLAKRFKLRLVFDREVNVRRMKIFRSAVRISVFNSGVAGLNSLLREWEVSARECVKIMLWCFIGNLELGHDIHPISVVVPFSFGLGKGPWPSLFIVLQKLVYHLRIKYPPSCSD